MNTSGVYRRLKGMNFSIKEHKTPIAVTAVGLLVAIGLASAPALLAESETEILASKNSDNLEKLSATVEGKSTEMEQQMNSLMSSTAARFSSLENQIQTLNKATTQLHRRQKSAQQPSSAITGKISSLENQVQTLHKATKQLNLRQKSAQTAKANLAEDSEPSTIVLSALGSYQNKTDTRMVNLEKAVSNLNKKHLSLASETASQIDQLSAANAKSAEASLAVPVSTETSNTETEETKRRRLEVDIRILQLERAIIQLGKKLDSMEVATKKKDPNVERLMEIRKNADRLLKQINK